jgi:hypothetical protein
MGKTLIDHIYITNLEKLQESHETVWPNEPKLGKWHPRKVFYKDS